jgi:hypothetical protein
MHNPRIPRGPKAARRALAAFALSGAAQADAALLDLESLTMSASDAWGGFALAITLVIVLLLWHVVDEEQPDVRSPRARDANHRSRARDRASERAEDRRAA